MNSANPVYLMSGGPTGSRNTMLQQMQQAISSWQQANGRAPKLAYIGTASGDHRGFFRQMAKMLVQAGAQSCDLVPLCGRSVDLAAAREQLQNADGIFVSGGEVDEGMQILQQLQLDEFLRQLYRQGRLFMGMSAGSIMIGSYWAHWQQEDVDSTSSLISCLGLVPVTFDTHCETEDWRELKQVLRLRGNGAEGYGIQTGNAVAVSPDGSLQPEFPLDHFINQNGEIKKIQ